MVKKVLAVLMMFGMLGGCAWICANGPQITSTLSSAVDSLGAMVGQLGPLAQYDLEINLAYIAAQGALVGAKALMAQSCPDPVAVTAVVESANKVILPQANMAYAKAKRMKLIK